MDKNKVYELFYKIISDSMEWASDYENYHKYVDGAADMAKEMIEYLDSKDANNKDLILKED